MGYNGGVIDIPLTSDVEGFVAEIKTKLKGVKNLGLQIDTSTLEEALDKYLDAYKKIANTKLNTSTFSKAQETMGKEIDDLKRRTDALEAGFAGLISVMESAEGGKFASQLADIKDVMQDLADVTIVTTNAISSMSNTEVNSSALEKTYTLLKEIQSLKDSDIGRVTIADNFKGAKKELITLFNDIQKKKKELEGIEVVSDEDKLKVAELQKEITEMSMTWQKMYTSSSSTFEDEFTGTIVKIGKAEKSFENLYDIVGKTIGAIQENVEQNLPFIENSLKTSARIAGAEGGVTVSANLGTTTKGLIDQLQRLLDSVQPYLDENPLEVNVSIATDWGTRRNKELLKQFQTQIDNLSGNTDVSEFKQIYEDIQKSFGNEINLKFKSNFDDEQKAIKAGVTALKAEIGKKFELNPKISSEAAKKLQEQLDKLSNNLILSIDSIKLTEGAIKDAGTLWKNEQGKLSIGADALSSVIDTMIAGSEKLNQELAPIWQLLVDIKSVLEQYPIQSIVDSTKELVSVIQRAFNILSTEDLDSIFSGLQKRAEAISGSLRLGENQKELKSLLAAYREYQELGGTHSLSELGGNDKVQQWFKRNKDIVLETTQAIEELDKAEDKVATDLKDASALDTLSVKIDDVLTKMQGTIESLDKIRTSLIEIANVSNGEKIVSIDTENISKITTAIGDLQTAIEKIQTSLSDGTIFKGLASLTPKDAENIEKVVGALAEMANVMPSGDFVKNISKIRSFVNTFSKEKGIERIEKAAEGINKLREALDGEVSSNSLLLIFQKISESSDVSGLLTELKSLLKVETAANQAAIAKKDFSEANKKMKESAEDSSVAVEKEKAALQKVIDKLDGLNQTKFMPGYLEQINAIKIAMSGVDDTASDASDSYKKLADEANRLWKEKGYSQWKKAAESSIASLETKIAKFSRTNSAMSEDFKKQLDIIRKSIHSGMSIEEVADLTTQFKKLDAAVNDAGQTGLSFFDTLKKRASGVNAQLIAYYLSFQDFIRYTRQAIEVVKDLDYALIDLKKTTTMTADELNQFYYDSNDVAKQMGVTTEEIINQAAAWSRLGYSSKEAATQMAALSSQFAQISPGMDVEKATDGLVSAMKAFHVDVADVESEIMDVINKTGNTMATTNEEIVDMLERSSSAMSAANNSIKETIALESAAVQITRNAETTGTAFRTISMRIRGYDEETEEYIGDIEELTGKVAELTKTAKTPGGISLFTDETKETYKSTYQILKDISEIYNDLSDADQAALLETLAGKRGGQVLAGILSDFSEVERAMSNMKEAAGSADAEMSIVEESLTYKINNLKQTWVGIVQELIDNGTLGRIVDTLSSISVAIGNIVTEIGPIASIITVVGLRSLLLHLEKFPDVLLSIANSIELISKLTKGQIVKGELVSAIDSIEIKTPKSVSAIKELGKVIIGLPTPIKIAAAAIGLLTVAVIKTKQANDELRKSAEKLSTQFSGSKEDISKYKEKIEELYETINNENTSYNDAKIARENLLSIQSQLLETYGKESESIKLVTEAINGQVDALDRLSDRQWIETLNEFNTQNLPGADWLNRLIHGASTNVDVMKADMEDVTKSLRFSTKDKDFAKKIAENYGGSLIYGSGSILVNLSGNLDEIYNKMLKIQQAAKDSGTVTNYTIGELSDAASKTKSLLDQYGDFYNQYNLYERIFKDDEYEQYYQDMVNAYQQYQDAFANGNKELSEKSKEEISNLFYELRNKLKEDGLTAEETGIYNTLRSLFPDLQAEIDKNTLKVKLEVDASDEEKNQLAEEILAFGNEETLVNYVDGSDPKLQAFYEHISQYADDAGVSVAALVALMRELELLEGFGTRNLSATTKNYAKSVGKGQVNGKNIREYNVMESALSNLNDDTYSIVATMGEAQWKKFNKELEKTAGTTDLVAAGVDKVTAALEATAEAYTKVKESSTSVDYTITNSVTGINTRLKSQFDELGSLYKEIFDGENGFTLENIDNDALMGIVDNFTKFNEELGLTAEEQEHVKEVAEDFMRVLTNEKSTSDQVQQAFNDLATTYFYDADGLKELNAKTAEAIEQQLEQMGVVNAHKVVQEQLNVQLEVQKNKAEAIAAANSDMAGTTKDASAEFWREANMAYAARVELANVVATTRILGNEDLDLSQQRDELKQLAAEAMGAAAALELERLIDDVDGAGLSLEEAWGQIYNKFKTLPELEINLPNVDGGASGAGKDAADEYVEAFEKELEALEKQRDAGIISESEFLDKYRELIERYFKDVDGYGEEYAERMADYWDKLISHMENVVSAIGKLLDKKKEAAEKGKEAAVSALEEEKEAAEKYYQDQIDYIDGLIDALEDEKDALQDQIDVLNEQIEAINEANTAREHSMALQAAEYQLQKSLNQRTKLVKYMPTNTVMCFRKSNYIG